MKNNLIFIKCIISIILIVISGLVIVFLFCPTTKWEIILIKGAFLTLFSISMLSFSYLLFKATLAYQKESDALTEKAIDFERKKKWEIFINNLNKKEK